MLNRNSLYWINFSLAIFIGFMLLIMFVVIILYYSILDTERATEAEFVQLILFTVYLGLVTASFAATAWALKKVQQHFITQQAIAIGLLLAGGVLVYSGL